MEAINSWLGTDVGGSGLLWLVLAVGAAVCLFAYGISMLVSNATDPVRRRLAEVTTPAAGGRESRPLDLNWLVGPLASYVMPKATAERDSAQAHLVQAGFRSQQALRNFYGMKVILAVTLPLVVVVASRWLPGLSTNMIGLAVLFAAFFGVRLPDRVLEMLRQRRIKRLRNGLPDALDLLVVCVESGLGLAPAIERVARELEFSHPDLAQELSLVNAEMRAGVERPVALRNLAARSGVDDINGLVGLLVQTIRFGTSVAEALRVYSEEFRDKRMQKAEEQAAKIGTKMIFPLVLCLFPSFFIVAVGPAILRIIAVFKQM
jgi:tight adherence protein C